MASLLVGIAPIIYHLNNSEPESYLPWTAGFGHLGPHQHIVRLNKQAQVLFAGGTGLQDCSGSPKNFSVYFQQLI